MGDLQHTAVQTPKGTKDFLPEDVKKKRYIERQLSSLYESYGYREIITPTIEFYDSLSQGDGPHMAESMYRFFDREGHALALRPDVTTPIARVVATRYQGAELPLKFHYLANVFRYGEVASGHRREFYQAGIELIGQKGPEADTEVVALAIESLKAIGLRRFQFDLGQVDFFRGLIEAAGLPPGAAGRVREALLRKDYVGFGNLIDTAEVPPRLREAFHRLPALRGGAEVLEEAESLAFNYRAKEALANLRAIVDELERKGLSEYVQIDLSLVKDLDYYTGLIFEGYTSDLGFTICDGGRYDHLIGQFGFDCPATGFAFGVERLMLCMDGQQAWPEDLGVFVAKGTSILGLAKEQMTIALPKGRLEKQLLPVLAKAGIDCAELGSETRKLILETPDGKFRFLLAKPTDVPTYVEYGAADIGIVGKDILLEEGAEVAELLDLGLGRCRVIVAVDANSGITDVRQLDFNSRVASKFVNIATGYFNRVGIQAEIVRLNGSVELGPIVGLADAVVDITETGTTLRENGLVAIATITEVSARLIANRVSYKLKHETIKSLVSALKKVL